MIRAGGPDELANREITLVLGDYGKRLASMHDRNVRNSSSHFRQVAAEMEWMYHFGPILELDGEVEDESKSARMGSREAREAMVEYVIERIYPVRMSLQMVREGRRFLLGDHIDSYVQDLKIRKSGSGFELIYERDF